MQLSEENIQIVRNILTEGHPIRKHYEAAHTERPKHSENTMLGKFTVNISPNIDLKDVV